MLRENLRKLSKPVDRTKWGMTPSTINAYYTPLNNQVSKYNIHYVAASLTQIAFPAGILQAPFFSMARPPSLNFGQIHIFIERESSNSTDKESSSISLIEKGEL